MAASSASTPSASVPVPSGPPGGEAPHGAENNSWKQRHALTDDQQRAGDELAARVRRELTELRSDGEFAPDATRAALLGLGLEPADVLVQDMRRPATLDSPPAGAVFAVQFGGTGCVIGDLRPERLQIEVTGVAAEFGCLEPYSH